MEKQILTGKYQNRVAKKLVEMAGIEPASKKGGKTASTCVAVCFSKWASSQQQDFAHFSAIGFAPVALRIKLRSLSRYFDALSEAAGMPQQDEQT